MQDGLVVAPSFVAVAVVRVPVIEEGFDFVPGEEVVGEQALLAQEPAEDHPRKQPDERLGVASVGVFLRAGRKARVDARPVEPVSDFDEEALVERLDIEGLLPRAVQGNEVGDFLVARLSLGERRKREVGENLDVRAMWRGERDVFNERDALQHVAGNLALVQAAIDCGESERVAVPEEHERRHRQEAIERARDAGELGAGVAVAGEPDGEEDVGTDVLVVHARG